MIKKIKYPIAFMIVAFDSYWYIFYKGFVNYVSILFPIFLITIIFFQFHAKKNQAFTLSASAITFFLIITVISFISMIINIESNGNVSFFYIIILLTVLHLFGGQINRCLTHLLLHSCVIAAAICILLSFFLFFVDFNFMFGAYGHTKRFGGVLLNPNNLGFYACIFFYLPFLIKQIHSMVDEWIFSRLLLSLFVLILSGSRSAALIFIIFLFSMILQKKYIRLKYFDLMLMIPLSIICLYVFNLFEVNPFDYLISRINMGIVEKGESVRFDIWAAGVEALSQASISQILFGHGSGAFNLNLGNSSHNTFLSFFYNQGFLLTCLFLAVITYLILSSQKVPLPIYVIIFGIITYSFTYDPFASTTNMMLVWVLFSALLLGLRSGIDILKN